MALPITIYGGGLADLTQGQLARRSQEDAAIEGLRNYLVNMDRVAAQRRETDARERVGMDANATQRFGYGTQADTQRYVTDTDSLTRRYGIDADKVSRGEANKLGYFQLRQQLEDAAANRDARIREIEATGKQQLMLQNALSTNPFAGNPRAAQDYFDAVSAVDQGNQGSTAITDQLNTSMPGIIDSIPSFWTSNGAFRDALGNNTNATPDQSILRSKVLERALTLPGAVDTVTGIPRISLPPAATNFQPVLRSPPSLGRRMGTPPTNSVSGPPVITSKAMRDALPAGAVYIGPDGKQYTKSGN